MTKESLFALLIALFFMGFTEPSVCQEIAITFDDAPRPDSAIMSADKRTDELLKALHSAAVEEAAFFALEKNLGRGGETRLRKYANAGHIIASHSSSHLDLHKVSAEKFLNDIESADRALSTIPGFRAWFRYPYLHEGDTVEKRDAIRDALIEMDYEQGYVTVDNYDWYIDKLAVDAIKRGENINFDELGELYIDNLTDAVTFYDDLARTYLGKSPRHVLLLHENDMAALFVDDLVARLRENGWKIIPASVAYEDPIARHVPDTLFLSQGRVAAIAHESGARPDELRSAQEDTSQIDAKFEKYVLQTK